MTDAEKLFGKVKTLEQGEHIVEALEQLCANGDAKKFINTEILSLIESTGKTSSYSNLLEAFKRRLFATPTVCVTLAFYPTKALITRLTTWFEDNLEEKVLLDLKVEPDIIGGVKILCNEHFRDYSIASKLEGVGLNLPKEDNAEASAVTI